MARIGTNMNVQVQATLGTPITDTTAITKASPPEFTTTGTHGLSDGDIVVVAVTGGMVELDGQAARIVNSAANTFELEGVDATLYSDFVAATVTVTEVATFHTVSPAQTVSMPDPTPNKIDVTTLIDKTKQILFGLPEAPDGSVGTLYDPQNAGIAAIKAATKTNSPLAFVVNWAGGQTTLFNSYVSGGSGFDLPQNDAAKSTIAFTPIKDVLDYAT